MPQVFSDQVTEDCNIKTEMMKKEITPKHSEGNHDLLRSTKDKVHVVPGEPGNFMSNDSLNRIHHCNEKITRHKKEQKKGSCCSSLDSEDGELGEDAALSDNNQIDVKKKTLINRPKVNCMFYFVSSLVFPH